jgi:hypothetical protein
VTADVGSLPLLEFDSSALDRLTHYAFRYPAKFHPPVVKKLLTKFSKAGQTCLDPFCGSGTLLVEAAAASRNAIGTDIDPLAVFVSRAKTHRHNTSVLRERLAPVCLAIASIAEATPRQSEYLLKDIDDQTYERVLKEESLWVPAIPNLHHWFRRMVTVQLARILQRINGADLTANERQFLLLCFGAIIRNCSNADPTPVSGLEVTSHMLKKEEEGRPINPLKAFAKAVAKNLAGAESYEAATDTQVTIQVEHADARKLGEHGLIADVIITSPPYHNAVDYYRRHQLEMYWLKLVADRDERLNLLPGYIGRPHVSKRHSVSVPEKLTSTVARWDARMRSVAPRRADDFLQYVSSMRSVAAQLVERPIAGVLASTPRDQGADADSEWFYIDVPTSDLTGTIENLYKDRTGYRYEYVRSGRSGRMVSFDPNTSVFSVNEDHPVVAANVDNPNSRLLLEHLITAEVLLEVYLRDAEIEPAVVGEILERRNILLSSLSRDQVYSLREVAENLRLSADNQYDLELNIVASARALGFTAKHISGSGEPDGLARFNNYVEGEQKFVLEAKSSADVPQLPQLDFATLKRHARKYGTEFCMLVAPAYPGFDDNEGAVSTNAEQQEVSCWLVSDLSRVVENAELLQISAKDILSIVTSAFKPAAVHEEIESLLDRQVSRQLYVKVVEVLRKVFSDGFLEEGDVRNVDQVAALLASDGTTKSRAKVKAALGEIASASQGLLRMNRDQILLLGELDELERRLCQLTGRQGPPRQAGTFRAPE